jgi:hypothetical protein
MKFSTDALLQLESYVKLVAAINRMKEIKPLVTTPVEIVFNPTYWDYQM